MIEAMAKINALGLTEAENARHAEDRAYSICAIMRIIARQTAALMKLDDDFDAARFIYVSGVTEDWLQARVLEWATNGVPTC